MAEPITPDTKVARLLEDYPQLEQVLIEVSPMFSKLRNPVLRRTIARVTSLSRAAEVAGISARDLVVRLREAAGLEVGDVTNANGEAATEDRQAPWVDPDCLRWTVDADALLSSGKEPVSEVMRRSHELGPQDQGLVRSSFRPAPLLEMLTNRGFRTSVERSEDQFTTFIGAAEE